MKLFYTIFLILFTTFIYAQEVVIFSENMGVGSGTLSIEDNVFENTEVSFSGNADTRSTGSSASEYTGASGGRNIFFGTGGGVNNRDIMISGINTEDFSNIQLSFGMNSNANLNLTLEYSTNNGATYTEVTYPSSENSGWKSVTLTDFTFPSVENLSLRFSKDDGVTYRLDDIVLVGEPLVPVLTVSPSSLSFSYIVGEESAPQAVSLSGLNTDGTDVTATLPTNSNFEISISEDTGYGTSVTLTDYDGNETSIFVRLKEGLALGMYSGEVSFSGGGADPTTVALSGEVLEEIFLIYEFTGETLVPAQSPPNAITSDFQVTGTTPTFNSSAAGWSGSGVPVAQSGSGWSEENAADAKYFFFTIDANNGFEMDVEELSFEWRATNAGPSAITVEINGTEISTFDAINNETTLFTAPLTAFNNLTEIEVRIKGWDNGSRSTSGTGILRINDVRLDGEIYATTSVIVANPSVVEGLTYIEGSGPSVPQSIAVSGISLDGTNVTASVPSNSDFEISIALEGTYSSSLTLTNFDGEATDVFVRLKATLEEGDYSDTITFSGGGVNPLDVSLSGEVKEEIFLIYEFADETDAPTQFPENATTSNFMVSEDGPVGFGSAQPTSWTAGSGVPYATNQTNWGATSAATAKYFHFTISANDDYEISLDNISFEWRATANGPAAITVEINGSEVSTFDAVENSTNVFSASLDNFLAAGVEEVEVRIKGWDNGSRSTDGSGFFRINDVRLDGEVDTSLSSPEFLASESFSIYPNPTTNGQFTVASNTLMGEEAHVRILNSLGQEVFAQRYTASSEIRVNAGRLSKGMYIVVLSQNNQQQTQKLIIR